MHEYLARFNKEALNFTNPNQEIFVVAFHNSLKFEQLNEPIKLEYLMEAIMGRVKCYIEGQ